MREASAHAYEHGLPLFQNWCAFFGAAIRLRQGHPGEALPKMQAAIAAADDRLSRSFRPFQLGCLADAHLQLGNPTQALAIIDAAIVTGEITGEKQSEVTLYRIKAQILLALGQSAESERHLRQALKIARRQKAKAEELRVALAMAEWKNDAIDANRARATLAQTYAAFEEGFDLPEMVTARAALDRVAPVRAEPY
jgi:tetratricopeptide (TPR) repeat protein